MPVLDAAEVPASPAQCEERCWGAKPWGKSCWGNEAGVGKSVFYSRVVFLNETARFWCRGSSHAASNASMGPSGQGLGAGAPRTGARAEAGSGTGLGEVLAWSWCRQLGSLGYANALCIISEALFNF